MNPSLIAATPTPTPAVTTFAKTIVSSGTFVDAAAITRSYDLLKVKTGNGEYTYIQWIPNLTNTNAGVVLLYFPYEGIDWTGLALDTTWAARGNGAFNDDAGPYYNAATSSQIAYTYISPATAGGEGFVYSYNGLHVAIVYGRYYAGSSVKDDVENVKNGLKFLHSEATLVDTSRIGLYSGSWGGLGVLYGTAASTLTPAPKALSILYPASDVKKLQTYIGTDVPAQTSNTTVIGAYNTFFDPYLRRIDKATDDMVGQATRYDTYSHPSLAGITSDVFIAHDDWDTLIPVSNTVSLLSTLTLSVKTKYFHRHNSNIVRDTFALGHTQGTDTMGRSALMGWTYVYLLNELIPNTTGRHAFYNSTDLVTQFNHVKAMYDLGKDTSFYNGVLAQLCAANLGMVDTSGGQPTVDGASILVALMNNLYQGAWATNGPAACAKLTTNPPF
ncbi:hypothetical protein CIK05_08230 [Bdellovibrio sp. qaytius]|nr:hypothetical protein CIK05_08230 [Bdellovibrio sp. qaytius]